MKYWIPLILAAAPMIAGESFDAYMFTGDGPGSKIRPWFTGPLLTPSGHVIPERHQNYEPYVYWIQDQGSYNPHWKNHSAPTFNGVLTQITMQFGVLPDTEFDIAP